VLYGIVRTAALFVVVALFFHLNLPHADYLAVLPTDVVNAADRR